MVARAPWASSSRSATTTGNLEVPSSLGAVSASPLEDEAEPRFRSVREARAEAEEEAEEEVAVEDREDAVGAEAGVTRSAT